MFGTLVTLIIGVAGGFLFHSLTMKVNFKQRTIDNKIKVFDSLIVTWIQMRNCVYAHHPSVSGESVTFETMFDQIYGQTQQSIGEAILVCDNQRLIEDINIFNERLYRTKCLDARALCAPDRQPATRSTGRSAGSLGGL